MKQDMTKFTMIKIITAILGLLLIFLLITNFRKIMGLLSPFIISFFIAYILNPLVSKMEAKGIKRSISIIIIYVIFIGSIIFLCIYMVPVIIREIGKLIEDLPIYAEKYKDIINFWQEKYKSIALPFGIRSAVDNNINRIQGYILSYLESVTLFIIAAVSKAFDIALIPVLVYYFLKDFKNITEKIFMLVPKKHRNKVISISSNVDSLFGYYVRSQLILSAVVFALTTIALYILKIDFALIIGIINGITNIIPYFGPLIGALPAVLIAFLQSPIKALYTIILLTIIQQIESDIICPKITGDNVGLKPLTVIFALVAGGELFGITGLILGVPVVAALKAIYNDIMKSLF